MTTPTHSSFSVSGNSLEYLIGISPEIMAYGYHRGINEHRFGSAAHGRTHAAYPCHGRADSDGRAQESQEEASGQKDG